MSTAMQQAINAGIEDFREWKQQDCCVLFPLISDLHSNLTESDPRNSQRRVSVDHLKLLFGIAEETGADFAADLGDDGFDVPLKTGDECRELLRRMEDICLGRRTPFIHCVGNHDNFFQFESGSWGSWLARMNGEKTGFSINMDGGYGSYTIPGKECCVFFLNTSDGCRAGFSEKQLAFLRNGLSELARGHTAIVLTHISPSNRARWKKYKEAGVPARFPELTDLLTSFVRSGGRLAGVFSGDSHFDYFDFEDGVNCFVTQGYGGISPTSELPPQGRVYHQYSDLMGRSDSFDSGEFCLIDLAAVKMEKREIRIFRLGAGGFNFHRGAKF